MKKWALALALALLLTGCGGLPKGTETENMALMRAMGVDADEETEESLVTVSSGLRTRGIQGEEEAPLILSAQRATVEGACQAIRGLGESDIFYGHVDQLLLGETLARRGVRETLERFSRDQELGLGAQVWLIRDSTAQEAIQAGAENGVDRRLSALRADSEMGAGGLTRTAGETLTDLLEDGSAYLPALCLSEEEESPLQSRGYGVLRGERLVGWLTGDAARGLELAEGCPGGELLELDGVAVKLKSASLSCAPVWEGETLQGVQLTLCLTAETETAEDREALKCRIAAWAERDLLETVGQLQTWGADCLSLGRQMGLSQPERWNEIREQWEQRFPVLTVEAECQVLLQDRS